MTDRFDKIYGKILQSLTEDKIPSDSVTAKPSLATAMEKSPKAAKDEVTAKTGSGEEKNEVADKGSLASNMASGKSQDKDEIKLNVGSGTEKNAVAMGGVAKKISEAEGNDMDDLDLEDDDLEDADLDLDDDLDLEDVEEEGEIEAKEGDEITVTIGGKSVTATVNTVQPESEMTPEETEEVEEIEDLELPEDETEEEETVTENKKEGKKSNKLLKFMNKHSKKA